MLALFDLDGTLLDTAQAHAHAAKTALARRGLPCDPDTVHRFLVAHDAASAGMDETAYYAVWQDMQPLYREAQHTVRTFPGVPEVLSSLAREGCRLGVVTSKRRWAVQRELEITGLAASFEVVVCREDTDQHKPSPQPLLRAQSLVGLRGGVYLGDQDTDVIAARAAGMRPIGAGWGWSGAAALRDAGAAAVIGAFAELPSVLREPEDDAFRARAAE